MEHELTQYQINTQLSDKGETVYIYEDQSGKRVPLNSLYSPKLEAERFVKKYKDIKKVVIMIGFGNGAIVNELINVCDNLIYLYVIEPFSEIELSFENTDIINKRASAEHYNEFTESSMQFRAMMERYRGADVEILIHPQYEKAISGFIKEIISTVRESLDLIVLNINTQRLFSLDWVIEPLLNIEYTYKAPSLLKYKGIYKGETAVLCASGPSLKESVSIVKKLQKSAFVFAAGSSFNGLLNNGIQPDFVTTYDAGAPNFETHFKSSKYEGPLIAGTTANSNILKHHQGPLITVSAPSDKISKMLIPDLVELPDVPSIAVYTLLIIHYLGFKNVYMVGQDLALINDQYYAEGVNEHKAGPIYKATLQLENNMGEMVGSNSVLKAFLESFVSLIRLIDKEEMSIYNLSSKGAKIEGAPYLPADEIKELPARSDIHLDVEMKTSYPEGIDKVKDIITKLELLSSEIHSAVRKMRYLKAEVATLQDLKLASRLLKKLNSNELFESVIMQQFSYQIQRLNNVFEFGLDKDGHSNYDRTYMVNAVKNMITEISSYMDKLMNDPRITAWLEQNRNDKIENY
jgi:hypothetical protein